MKGLSYVFAMYLLCILCICKNFLHAFCPRFLVGRGFECRRVFPFFSMYFWKASYVFVERLPMYLLIEMTREMRWIAEATASDGSDGKADGRWSVGLGIITSSVQPPSAFPRHLISSALLLGSIFPFKNDPLFICHFVPCHGWTVGSKSFHRHTPGSTPVAHFLSFLFLCIFERLPMYFWKASYVFLKGLAFFFKRLKRLLLCISMYF